MFYLHVFVKFVDRNASVIHCSGNASSTLVSWYVISILKKQQLCVAGRLLCVGGQSTNAAVSIVEIFDKNIGWNKFPGILAIKDHYSNAVVIE